MLAAKPFLSIMLFLGLNGIIAPINGAKVYAQDPLLLQHTWYFLSGTLEGESFTPPQQSTLVGQLVFNEFTSGQYYLEVYHPSCQEGFPGEVFFNSNSNQFNLSDGGIAIVGDCSYPEYLDYMDKHYSIFIFVDTGIAKNPFTYTIEPNGEHYLLTIENADGDSAIYSSVLLSSPKFNELNVALYPNPVKETLVFSVPENDMTSSFSVSIYDLRGTLLLSQNTFIMPAEINISFLNKGIYLMTVENDNNLKGTATFIKE